MTTATAEPIPVAPPGQETIPEKNYLSADYSLRSWLTTTDHKRIGILYLFTITFFFAIGGIAATLMRIDLISPSGLLVSSTTYNKLFTMHGLIMIFFFMVPAIPGVLGNFLVPIMIGARDMAFPRLNLASWYILMTGGAFTMFCVLSGGVDTGWTFYTPYSSIYADGHVIAMATGVIISGFSSIATGLNFIVTIHKMRASGMTWMRLPLFVWTIYGTSLIQVLATPVLAITLTLIALERIGGLGIFNPKMGGDPVLFQHLFWFYSHPAVYIMLLPSMGVVSEVVTCFSRRRLFGYRFVAVSTIAIATLSFLVWGHHMFVSSQSVYSGMIFSLLSFLIAIPSAIKVFNWVATMYKGSIYPLTPMLYAMGFIALFTMGGLTGLFVASLAVDVHLTQTYFIVAHFHFIMVGGTLMAYLGGIHFWWPKLTGRMYPERLGQLSALLIFSGFLLTFFPQFALGYLGMPRRYAVYAPEFQTLNVLSSAGASIMAIGLAFPFSYLIWSYFRGPVAGPNPWRATGLEWKVPSPPPTENFAEKPVVDWEAYAYPTGTPAAEMPAEIVHS